MRAMATAPNAPPRQIPFLVFSAANEAASLLFELIQAKASPPCLISNENTIGYHLSLPLSPDDADADADEDGAESGSSGFMRWIIGAGPPPSVVEKRLKHAHPHVLLCTPGDTPASNAVRSHVKDLHAIVKFHPSSGVLMLQTFCDRPIVYERGDVHDQDLTLGLDEWGNGKTCVLRRERNYLRFGPYRFLLEFVAQTRGNYDMFTAHLNEHINGEFHGLNPSRLFNFIPMPSPYHKTLWNVWLHHRIPTTGITAGVNIHTGRPVAVKKVWNKDVARTRRRVIDRLQMALQYRDSRDGGILGIVDIWCDHQTSPPCLFNTHDKEMVDECRHTFYSMPLASYNFLDLPWTKVANNIRLAYLHQTLLGLANLHRQGLVHGNIRPGSLLVLGDAKHAPRADAEALETKRAAICFSMSRVEKKMFDATRICIPPEVWQNKRATARLDEAKGDVWALAASWLYAFILPPSTFKVATRQDHLQMQAQLDRQVRQNSSLEPFVALLRRMLAWEPQHRPSAAEALESDAWQSVWADKQRTEERKKRKRTAQMRPDGVRRVRVLSPNIEDVRVIES
ncbi:hypothetical protein Trco_007079 [Trichoderma cornu-damae]|uniref:Protein kinase domain-containing protein n=1 Tax=Trichoderma cornu-damae TaxID=654480 RepID=A0A9P8QMT5_9HYPO|nr:hypothetical protein Trco_007079 [Trichoderma cornu-damae]